MNCAKAENHPGVGVPAAGTVAGAALAIGSSALKLA